MLAIGARLSTLSHPTLDLVRERDPLRLLDRFCAHARRILGSAYAAAIVLEDEEGTPRHWIVSGMDAARQVAPIDPCLNRGLLGRLITERHALRARDLDQDTEAGCLPGHPPTCCLLGVPVSSATHFYGVLYFGNKLGYDEFSEEDEDVAGVLASEMAALYENAWLCEVLQRHAAKLQLEVTEHKRTRQELEGRMQELSRSNAELENYAYVASHDLQEPLRMVTCYVRLLAERYRGGLDADADEFIGFALGGATRMRELIDDLLAYSRLGAQVMSSERVDAEKAIAAAVANLRVAIDEARARVTHDTLPTVLAEGRQLVQLFQNLIANAVKFRRPGEPPTVHVGATRDEDRWLFSVRDNGIGIEREHSERIFGVFQRVHGKTYPGTGIGLALCKKIVERQGGRIWVESESQSGSTFYFTLPAAL